MNKPLLIVFLGFPGSGKTYFSKNLARQLGAVTFNTDALRLAMFGSLGNIDQIRNQQRSRLYDDVFGAMYYAARQTLKAGHTVVCDAQQTKRSDRRRIEELAAEAGAIPVLVWIKTSPEVALQRGQQRQASDDSLQYSADKMHMLIERFDEVTDLPDSTENLVEINGEMSFTEQYVSFQTQVAQIMR